MEVVPDTGEAGEVGVHQLARLVGRDAELAAESVGAQPVRQAVGHALDAVAQRAVHRVQGQVPDLRRRGRVDVLTRGERVDEAGVARQVGHHPQLDLAVVGQDQGRVALAWHERPADLASLRGADRDVLDVGVL